jgi:hypothetical protein
MIRIATRFFAISAAALLCACAGPQTKYAWGNYEEALYVHYKAPSEIDAFAGSLQKTITQAEGQGKKVGPGIYAEYGYILQSLGKFDEAIRFYEKEKAAWPEAGTFMNTMIRSASEAQKKGVQPKKVTS